MSEENGKALATRPEHALLRPVVSPAGLIEAQKETHQLIADALEKDRDYGKIPGTNKPTLLKPGAERLNLAFGVYPDYMVTEQETDHDKEVTWKKRKWAWGEKRGEKIWSEESGTSLGFYRYVVRCELKRRATDEMVGVGIGSASTLESRYVDRPRELENTVLKMAQKRALVAATLNAYALSDRFTQDMEDAPQDDNKPDKPAQQRSAPQSSSSGDGGPCVKFKPKYGADNSNIDQGMPLIDVDDTGLHAYRKFMGWALDNDKKYSSAEHLTDIDAEIARRENGEERKPEQPADDAPPPHDDSDIPF